MEAGIEVAVKLWEKAADASASYHKRGDEAVKFYIGAGTALAAWLMTHQMAPPLSAFAVACIGVFGAGHVVYCHNRGCRLMWRANSAAEELARLTAGPSFARDWNRADALSLGNLMSPGHPAAQILFNGLAVLLINTAYAAILYFKAA